MEYNKYMKKIKTAIIGGGASGLILFSSLSDKQNVLLFERGERVGRKLSATGNGQGNVTNLGVLKEEYFSFENSGAFRIGEILRTFDDRSLKDWFSKRGVLLCADDRGRVYPTGRQASALTDALRFSLAQEKGEIALNAYVSSILRRGKDFLLKVKTSGGEEEYLAENVVLCTGGKAAKNFGTDGSAYALAESLGHTVTPLYPSLVQLKTDTTYTKPLKGIRVNGGVLTAHFEDSGEKRSEEGDIIFTDYGVSGDATFRISAFLTDKIGTGKRVGLSIDFLPDVSEAEIYQLLIEKKSAYPDLPTNELLFGIVNNQIGRAIFKRANGDVCQAAKLVKEFSLSVTGTLGFDYAQVTKGGVLLSETDENLESRFVKGLYFAGEILDVDGQCGGYNLQWAYSSAQAVAAALNKKELSQQKDRGQV